MQSTMSHEEVFQATSNGVIATDVHGIVTLVNRQAEKILNMKAEKMIGRRMPDILPLTGPLVMSCLETGHPRLGHHIFGKHVDLVLNITTIQRDGKPQGAVCNFLKMQEFEMSARRLESYRRLNEQWNAIFRSSSDGIWVCDGEGRVININEASEKMNGIRAEKIIGKDIAEVVQTGLFDRSVTLEILETKRQVSIMQYVKKTKKYLLVTGTPTFDEHGNISLVVVNERDMTLLNNMREQLEETRMVTEKYREELAGLRLLELEQEKILGESQSMKNVLRVALKLAYLGASNILVLGESGAGKGLLAKFIHKNSRRSKRPFIQINCAALPESLLEAELFGYEKGAFTGAREQGKAGLFELARDGTLFLDEIGDLPLSVQSKLLKYLDDHEIMRIGALKPRQVDCTVIAATNRDLESLTRQKRFREDLYYRLSTFPVRIPPLRERPEDIFAMTDYFLKKYNKSYHTEKNLSPRGFGVLQGYSFPGNVRELQNILKKAVVLSDSPDLDDFIVMSLKKGKMDWSEGTLGRQGLKKEMAGLEKKWLKRAVRSCRSTREMASFLGVSQPTVVRKMKRYGISQKQIQK